MHILPKTRNCSRKFAFKRKKKFQGTSAHQGEIPMPRSRKTSVSSTHDREMLIIEDSPGRWTDKQRNYMCSLMSFCNFFYRRKGSTTGKHEISFSFFSSFALIHWYFLPPPTLFSSSIIHKDQQSWGEYLSFYIWFSFFSEALHTVNELVLEAHQSQDWIDVVFFLLKFRQNMCRGCFSLSNMHDLVISLIPWSYVWIVCAERKIPRICAWNRENSVSSYLYSTTILLF